MKLSNFSDASFLPIDRPYTLKGNGITIHPITLGKCSYVGNADVPCEIHRPEHILIGRFCSLAGNISFFMGNNHEYKKVVTTYPFDVNDVVEKIIAVANIPRSDYVPKERRLANKYQIIVGNDVWIGRGATIIGGVKIGSGAIIGTNAMVAKDIPPYAIAVGNPIKIIKYRFDDETIKKFLAIKWWNWDLKKIYENIPLMNNPEKFLEKHYRPELSKISYENIPGGVGIPVEKYLADGRQVYSFIADFRAPQPLWRRIISGFCKSDFTNAVLIIYLGEGVNQNDIAELKKFIAENKLPAENIIHCIPPIDNKIFSPYIIRNSTHFITTREMISLECMDYLWDTDVKIISALDENIFTGEPKVDWNIIK